MEESRQSDGEWGRRTEKVLEKKLMSLFIYSVNYDRDNRDSNENNSTEHEQCCCMLVFT